MVWDEESECCGGAGMAGEEQRSCVAAFLARSRRHTQPYQIDIGHLGLTGFVVYPDVLSPKYGIDSKFFPQAVAELVGRGSLLEIGTGSGVVAVHCGRTHGCAIVATDISEAAVANCRENTRAYQLPRIEVRQGSLFEPVGADEEFDVVFWNHPWICEQAADSLEAAVFDPGYCLLRRYFCEAPKHVAANGQLLLGTSDLADLGRIQKIAEDCGLSMEIVTSQALTALDAEGRPFSVRAFIYRFTPETRPAQYGELDIAVVGMSCRLPGADDLEAFWLNLQAGRESISRTGKDEGSFIGVSANVTGVDLFDASFFGISAREAAFMDPQHRLFLEEAWRAFEDARCDPRTVAGAVGVFASAAMNSYYVRHVVPSVDLQDPTNAYLAMIGNDKDFLATRVSYVFDLKGPSMTVQTACSSSLVAVHQAMQSLLSGECDLALAGGVAIPLALRTGYFYKEGMIASPDGHCRAFDADANGTVFGSGVGIVVLKRVQDAIADGDRMHAVLKGSAVNNDGSGKAGYTAPSVAGQVGVITEALSVADVDATSISYVEAHGTGTPVGDPIEMRALIQAFGARRTGFCAVGSVKTNIGHLDAASGVVGLIKTVLALKNRQLPPSLHYRSPNPEIDFAQGPFFVNDRLRPWVSTGGPRRAGVSSFGVGGTNAHVVLEEARAPVAELPQPKQYKYQRVRCWMGAPLDEVHPELYEVQWREQALPAKTLQPDGTWLVFADADGVGEELSMKLGRCFLVRPGTGFRVCEHRIEMDPEDAACYRQLLAHVGAVTGMVHLWSLNVLDPVSATRLGCGSVLRLLQAFTRMPEQIWLATRAAAAMGQPTSAGVAQSPLWGMSRVVQLEYPDVHCGIVDLETTSAASTLVAEIAASSEEQVAYRNGARYVPRLVAKSHFSATSVPIQADGCYLITGGLGVIGIEVAAWLVQQGARHLVLAGRRRKLSEAVEARVQALEATGAVVEIAVVDVCDRQSLAELVAAHSFRGVMHAAGTCTDRLLCDMPCSELESVLAAKTIGAWNLHELTRERPLEFFVCFSSAGSVWGAQKQGHYDAANYFLDALAHHRRSLGLPALSINWGVLATGGICTRSYCDWLEKMGVLQIKIPRMLVLLESLLGGDAVQVVAADLEQETFVQVYNARRSRALLTELVCEDVAETEAEPVRSQNELVDDVRSIVHEVIGLPGDEADQDERGFTDLGMDSMLAVALRAKLEEAFQCRLAATIAFDYPNVQALTAYIARTVFDLPSEPGARFAVEPLPEQDLEAAIEKELREIEDMLNEA